jgi:hypothetical protein
MGTCEVITGPSGEMVQVWVMDVSARLAIPIFDPETATTLWVPAEPHPSIWNENPAPASASPASSEGMTIAAGGGAFEHAMTDAPPTPMSSTPRLHAHGQATLW